MNEFYPRAPIQSACEKLKRKYPNFSVIVQGRFNKNGFRILLYDNGTMLGDFKDFAELIAFVFEKI